MVVSIVVTMAPASNSPLDDEPDPAPLLVPPAPELELVCVSVSVFEPQPASEMKRRVLVVTSATRERSMRDLLEDIEGNVVLARQQRASRAAAKIRRRPMSVIF